MSTIEVEKLPQWLAMRRWFGGKGLPIKRIELLDHVPIGGEGRPDPESGVVLSVIQVHYEIGTTERYLLAAAEGGTKEALDDDELARGLLRIIREEASFPTASGHLEGRRLQSAQVLDSLSAQPVVRRLAAEQSNSSLVFDDTVILKVIRKLDLGLNPEWELGRVLAERGFDATPQLLGAIELRGAAESTLAVAHRFVKVDADGWSWLLGQLRQRPEVAPELRAQIRALGESVGRLHRTLGQPSDNRDLSPEPILAEDFQRWSSSIIGELGVTAAAAGERVPELSQKRKALVERISRLAHATPSGRKIRIHGDLHLGQTLRTEGRWLLFDFEGEPARSYAQRREKQSPLKDVAGMLRSFGYAAATLELEGAPPADRLTPLRTAFLEGYRAAVAGTDLLPGDEKDLSILLDTLEVEKLLYELRYEVRNRPDWVKIPARALLDMETA